ncbi:MAG: diaminopimelate epimerase [Peptococcaceae bacterium]|jgi:diaminopimelate epimerase|nr:diaminopimelate epimerase [Peptococcaceae bacterium]MDH7524302.1 diaminopimelate epimerase [Peptococcaceae bacterium]
MKFRKVHGLGNDFIVIDGIKENLPNDLSKAAWRMCDRHFGIGADGLVVILPSNRADIRMRIINSDGSEAEMCGNAIRCFAKLVYELGYVVKDEFSVETLAGLMVPRLVLEGRAVKGVTVDMGEPALEKSAVPMLGPEGQAIDEPLEVLDTTYRVTCLLMGVPHCVIFADDVEKVDLYRYGPAIEKHPVFPRKTNVHFVEVISDHELKMRIWERGAGPTLACGTGACGVLVAAVLNKKTGRKARIQLPGGFLDVEWAKNNHVYMTGPAMEVFRGEISDTSLIES